MGFLKGVFSDNGQPSFSRLASGFVVIFACIWVTKLVFHNYALPDFAGLALFIGTLYGLNRVTTAFGKPQTPQGPTQP